MKRREMMTMFGASAGAALLRPEAALMGLMAAGQLSDYEEGIAVCQNLYYGGDPHNAARLLPHYSRHTTLLAQQPGLLQPSAARLSSQAQLLACEIATDREDFGTAQSTGQASVEYARLAGDPNVEVAGWISLANLGFHRKLATAALNAYLKAVSLLDERVTPLLKGRVYAGLAETYAMRQQKQESLRSMGLAYEYYPLRPEEDPAYPYLRASRYSLHVFGAAQSYLFLGQPKEAAAALQAMSKETNDPEVEPITKVDLLYYEAQVAFQQAELEPACSILRDAAQLARSLGSSLYYNKLAQVGTMVQARWPYESATRGLDEVFQPC